MSLRDSTDKLFGVQGSNRSRSLLATEASASPKLGCLCAVSLNQVAADAFGNALGDSIVAAQQPKGVDWSQAPDQSDAETRRLARSGNAYAAWPDQTDAETARLGRYEEAAQQREAANNRTLLNTANRAADDYYYSTPTPEQLQAAFRQSERNYRNRTEKSVAGSGYVARDGDSISSIVGSSSTQAIGNFMRANRLASSNVEAGRNYFRPDEVTAYGDSVALGQAVLNNDNARLVALAARTQGNSLAGLAYANPPAAAQGKVASAVDLIPTSGGYTAPAPQSSSTGGVIGALIDGLDRFQNTELGRILQALPPEGAVAGGLKAGLIGLAALTKVDDAVEVAAKGLGARVEAVHGALDPIAAGRRTTTALDTVEGTRVLAAGGRDLSPAQRAMMESGEVAAKLPGAHAEVTALQHAAQNGLTPAQMAVSRTICPTCRAAIEQSGGQLTSPTTAIWPR